MKKLIFLLLLCASTFAADRVTVTLTITNNPSAAQTFTVNAATRTWRASVTAPSTEVLIGADIGASATNLFRQLASYQLAGPVSLGFSSSNVITIQGRTGQAMAASISAAYGVVTLSTNAGSDLPIVRVPFSSEAPVPQTNNPTLLATGMGTYSQSPFAAGTTLLQNILQTSGAQSASGLKTFTGGVVVNTLEVTTTTTITGDISIENDATMIEFNDTAAAADTGKSRIYLNNEGFSLFFVDDAGTGETSIFSIGRTTGTQTSPLAEMIPPLTATLTNSTIKASTLDGTNSNTGIFSNARVNHTALANGNNAGVDFGETVYAKVKAGPSAAFTINGIAGGTDGRMLIIDNSIAQNMTIANDSGVEPTAANRIYTRTGSDVATTGQGVVTLIYDSEDSRWILVSVRD